MKGNFGIQPSRLWHFLLAHVIAGLCVHAGHPSYRVDQWKTEHGLPQNSVQALYQSRDGYLWTGTLFGLARYDGFRFTVFDQANTPAMAATTDDCTCIAQELFENTLWIGTSRGLLRYAGDRFDHFKKKDGLLHNSVLALAASKRGGVWIGTHDGLGRYAGGKFALPATARELAGNIHCLIEDPETNLWAGTGRGVVEFRASGEVIRHSDRNRDVLALHRDRQGTVWIGYKDTGALHALSNGVRHTFRLPPVRPGFAPDRSVAYIFEDSTSNLWVNVTGDDLMLLRNGELKRFESVQTAGISTRRSLEDAEGNLWFGTGHEGLLRLQPRRLMTHALNNGSGHDRVWSVAESSDGAIWMGTDDGVLRLKNGHFEPIPFAGAGPSVVHSTFVDASGAVWAARASSGVWKFNGTNFVRQFTKQGAGGIWDVSAIYQQRDGKLWFGSNRGLWLWASNTLTRFTPENGLAHPDVRCLLEDSHSNLWIAAYSGLACLSNGIFTGYTTKDGLSHNQVYFLHEDNDGALWIGTQLGLTRMKNGNFFAFTTRHGLFDNVVNQLFEDGDNGFWIGCNRGIYRVDRAELEAVADGKTNRVTCIVYGEADGMLSSETNGEHQPAGCRARDGRLWFPTMKGAVVIDPDRVHRNERPPAVIIEEVTVDEEPVISNRPVADPLPAREQSSASVQLVNPRAIKLPPGRARSLQIRYTATSLVDPDKVRFRYQLVGHDSKWQEAAGRRMALYTNLRPGNYTFHVKACNNHGYWNEAGDSFAFTLAPYFYQTRMFYVVSVLVVGAAAYGIHRWRLRLAQRIQELKASIGIAEERARIAKDMHDDIGANLTRIGLLNEVARNSLDDPERARTEMNKVAVITGETIGGLSELVWATNSNYDTLENTIVYLREYVARFFEPSDIRVTLKFPSDVPRLRVNFTFRRQLVLIVKEALNNVIKHAKASQVFVEAEVRGQQLYLCIRDHGCGITPQPCRASATGLQSIQHRVEALNGTLTIDSKPKAGTCVEILLPLEAHPMLRAQP